MTDDAKGKKIRVSVIIYCTEKRARSQSHFFLDLFMKVKQTVSEMSFPMLPIFIAQTLL